MEILSLQYPSLLIIYDKDFYHLHFRDIYSMIVIDTFYNLKGEKKMNKKIIAILIVLAITLVLLIGYNTFLSPEGVEGEKEVTITIINEDEDIDKSFTFNTDHEFLLDLVEEKEDELGAEFLTSDFGTMIVGMLNYKADDDKQEFFHIAVNGEDATTGAGDIPLNDGDTYKFELMNY